MIIKQISFSPNGNTKEIASRLAAELAASLDYIAIKEIDITPPNSRLESYDFDEEDLVVFGMPTYAGKLPNKILPFIQSGFKGKGVLAVPVVTFGNRSFDNSLAELAYTLCNNGLKIVGAGAFVTKHAFSDILGNGRPDEDDNALIKELAGIVTTRISSQNFDKISEEVLAMIPGAHDAPYYTPLGIDGQPASFLKAVPKTNPDLCTDCKICCEKCPMGSIDYENPASITGICIKCHACVNGCPTGAKYFDDPAFLSHKAMLEKNYTGKKQSVIW